MTQDRLKNPLIVTQFSVNLPVEFELDKAQDWVNELLTELNENANQNNSTDQFRDTFLKIKLRAQRVNHSVYHDVILFNLLVESNYRTTCVKTLQEMISPLSFHSSLCFVSNIFEKEEELSEQTELFINNELHELYFFDKRKIDIKEAIHEQIYLYVDQYPSIEKLNDSEENGELH